MNNIIYFCIIMLLSSSYLLNAQESPHKSMKLECNICHNTENWNQIFFDHNNTNFPLVGKHKTTGCIQCHDMEDFWKISGECRSCHTDFHRGKLSIWCESCHTPAGWTMIDQQKAHANTTFPLLGKHARLDCDVCHYIEVEGEFSPLKSDCYSCHETAYRTVTSPNHQQLGFSAKCDNCHSMFSWQPAEFREHDIVFPIFSATHAGEWNNCSICHFNANNFRDFSCLNCHEHNREEMDEEHRDVPGYVYESNSCYNCHPTGTAEG